MASHPLDDLIADVKARPLPYALVAGAGIATAVLLATRVPGSRRSVARVAVTAAGAQLSKRLSGDAAGPVDAVQDKLRQGARRMTGSGQAGEYDDQPDDERGVTDRLEGAVRETADKLGIGGRTAAVFAGTFLSKVAMGWLRAQDEDRARRQGFDLGAARRHDSPAYGVPLQERTVTELRELASEHEISGRSSMNKDELVEALERT